MCGSASAHRDLDAQAPVVGDRLDGVHRVELAPRVGGVVNAAHAEAELEAQVLIVAQVLADLDEVLAGDVKRELAAVDDDGLDRGLRLVAEELLENVDDLVEPAPVGALRRGGRVDEAS